jgi:hypothetical protein
MQIIEILLAISKLPSYQKKDEGKLKHSELFEFRTNWGHCSAWIRKKDTRSLQKVQRLHQEQALQGDGNFFRSAADQVSQQKWAVLGYPWDSLFDRKLMSRPLNILEQVSESPAKRQKRLQSDLKHGLDFGNTVMKGKWDQEKLARFRASFPDIELSYHGRGWWQVPKDQA